jgi:hypothetical protein
MVGRDVEAHQGEAADPETGDQKVAQVPPLAFIHPQSFGEMPVAMDQRRAICAELTGVDAIGPRHDHSPSAITNSLNNKCGKQKKAFIYRLALCPRCQAAFWIILPSRFRAFAHLSDPQVPGTFWVDPQVPGTFWVGTFGVAFEGSCQGDGGKATHRGEQAPFGGSFDSCHDLKGLCSPSKRF